MQTFANLVLDSSVFAGEGSAVELGDLALGAGDVTGDGIDDLIFLSDELCDGSGVCTFVLRIVAGGATLDRQLNGESLLGSRDITLAHDASAPASVQLLNWDGDDLADVLVVGGKADGSTVGYIFLGADIGQPGSLGTATPIEIQLDPAARTNLANSIILPLGLDPASNFDASFVPAVTTAVVGDVNGDGLDDVLFAMPEYLAFTGALSSRPTIGRTYLLLGTPTATSTIELTTDSAALFDGNALGATVSGVGDLNQDGFDEFAITRAKENNADFAGGAFVFAGRADFSISAAGPEQFGVSDALLTLARS